MALWETIFCGFLALNLIFVTCESGQRASNAFNKMGKIFAEIDWYLLPIQIQRMLPIIMIYSQDTIEIRFFGNISCSRIQFQKVLLKCLLKTMSKPTFFILGVPQRLPIFYGAS